MGYIGNDLQVAYPNYTNIDDISSSFNGVTTSFPLTIGGVAPVPAPRGSNQCLISVGGVIQRPDDTGSEGFRLSGGNIIFSSAPNTGEDFFGVVLAGADYLNVGANFPSGTSGTPSITFDSDLDTGIYNSAANELSFTTGGTQRLTISSAGQLSNNLGSAAAPSYSFSGDVNTGIYSPGADQVAISTNGTGRLFIDSSGRLGIGTSSPNVPLQVIGGATVTDPVIRATNSGGTQSMALMSGGLRMDGGAPIQIFQGGSEVARIDTSGRLGIGTTSPAGTLHLASTYPLLYLTDTDATGAARSAIGCSDGNLVYYANENNQAGGNHIFYRNGANESARLDSSGRLLVGTSSASAVTDGNVTAQFEIEGTTSSTAALSIIRNSNDGNSAGLIIAKTRGTTAGSNTSVTNGDTIGDIRFEAADGTQKRVAANIYAQVDGTPGTNDMPGRLVFSVTQDGSASPTEALRITNDRYVRLASGTGGIQFNGDTAAANALDDYEEGAWTVSVADANTGGNVSATTATAYYTKIGRFVECIFDVNNIDTTGLTAGNDIYIRGFPFTWAAIAVRGQGSVHVNNITFAGYLTLEATGGHTTCRITENASNSGVDFVMVSELSSGSARITGRISGIV